MLGHSGCFYYCCHSCFMVRHSKPVLLFAPYISSDSSCNPCCSHTQLPPVLCSRFPMFSVFPFTHVFPVNGKLTSVPLSFRKWFYHEALEGFQYTETETSFPDQNMVMLGPSGSNTSWGQCYLLAWLFCLWVPHRDSTALCLMYLCLKLVVVSGEVRLCCRNRQSENLSGLK